MSGVALPDRATAWRSTRAAASRTAARPPAAVAVLLAVALAVAMLGGTAALVGAGVALGVVALAATGLLRYAWDHRAVAGPAVLFLATLPLLVLLSAQDGYERSSLRLLRDDIAGVALGAMLVSAAVLVFAGVRTLALARRSAGGTPWRTFVGRGADGSAPLDGIALLVAGPLLVLVTLLLAGPLRLAGPDPHVSFGAAAGAVVLSFAGVLVAPALAAVAVIGRGDRAERERALQRQAVAAHLHDSVLQTFALVQRRIDDPDEVRRLIRRQERELRDWLAGRDAPRPDTLGGALREVADEVEAELGAAIELELVGDRDADDGVARLADAVREALRNAARHGGGSGIRVVADSARDVTVVYVRDEGPGFALQDVPPERRGIRDAIIARMDAAGGSAEIDTAPGAGTEVVLRLPATGGAA